MLARLHAQWWMCPGTPQRHSAGADIVTDVWLGESNFRDCLRLPRYQYVPRELHDRERFRNAVYALWDSNARATHCVVHGDLAIGNCFFDADGSPGFLDGQGDTLGCWAYDYTVFIITSMDIAERRANERALLEHYLQQLRSHDVDAPRFEEAWLQYRRNVIWPATAAVLPVQFQPEIVCTGYTQRAMTAATDLDTLGSLEHQ
jgi:aminoglycoside phosphotransferase (APT) family kinase protein